MKIRIQSDERSFSIVLPTWLVFSKGLLKFGIRVGKKYSGQMPDITPQAIDALCGEMKRIKKKYGTWELVDVRSAEGERVQILI